MTQVFISYSRRDLAFVEQLAADLKAAGLDVWYDLSGLEGGARWSREIEKAIRASQYVLVVLTPDSVASVWVEEEYLFASKLKKKIIPLFYKECDLPLGYYTRHFIDIQGINYKQNFDEILRALDVKSVAQKELSLPKQEKLAPGKPEKQQAPESLQKERPKLSNKYIITIIGTIAVIIIGLLASPLVKGWPSPAETMPATQTSMPDISPTDLPTEITDEFDVDMVLVPAGSFFLGSNNCDGHKDECPQIDVYLDVFYIDKYEVTNSLYKSCVDAQYCQKPGLTKYFDNPDYSNHPVVYIAWAMANTFCEWRGARLPTEAEWEKAAHGTDIRTFPWGEKIDCDHANYNNCVGETTEVGTYELGISPYGIYDMSGNAFEWVADWYQEDYYSTLGVRALNPQGPDSPGEISYKVLRGGSWSFGENFNRSTARSADGPLELDVNGSYGFRCARDVTP